MNESIKFFEKLFKKNNYEFTNQKKLILNAIIDAKTHVNAKEIYEMVKDKNIGFATVYRSLKVFNKLGIVKEINVSGTNYYEMKIFSKKPLHIHFKCYDCNSIIDIDSSKIDLEFLKLNKIVEEKNGLEIHDTNIMLYGLCRTCREELKCQDQQSSEE